MAETLRQKQSRFVRLLPELIHFADDHGYELTLGEAYRPPAQSRKGGSLHSSRLAIDLNLFRDGVWLKKTEDHRELGEFWESIGGTWGGRFGDGNHYSISHAGLK